MTNWKFIYMKLNKKFELKSIFGYCYIICKYLTNLDQLQ